MVIVAPIEAIILIILPFFIATIATIIYTNKKMRISNYDDDDSNKGTNLFYPLLISAISYGASTFCDF
jgi:hypothetical protein